MRNTRKSPKRVSKTNPVSTFFIVFFVLAAVIIGWLALDFFSGTKRSGVLYTIGKNEYTLSAKEAYNGDTLLVCFDDIAVLCEMTETGSAQSRTFFAANSEQSIAIEADSQIALLNGTKVDMLATAKLRDGKLYVPLAFVEQYMSGIEVTHDGGDVEIRRGEYNASTKNNPLYQDTVFTGTAEVPLDAPDASLDKTAPTYSFATDLSAYEPYMCPEDPDAYLILVNRETTISAEYVPGNLVEITNVRKDGRTERMVETAEKALQALFIEMRAAGYTDVSVTSGYRSYEKQAYLYNLYTENEMKAGISRAEAQKIVDTYSAQAGTSEHQTGLCCDMHNLGSASQKFAKEEAYTWLIENCYKFGFILRFPEGKEDITGYSFEPWHYRFVGRYHASEMHRLDMCLEEYIEYLAEKQ